MQAALPVGLCQSLRSWQQIVTVELQMSIGLCFATPGFNAVCPVGSSPEVAAVGTYIQDMLCRQ